MSYLLNLTIYFFAQPCRLFFVEKGEFEVNLSGRGMSVFKKTLAVLIQVNAEMSSNFDCVVIYLYTKSLT